MLTDDGAQRSDAAVHQFRYSKTSRRRSASLSTVVLVLVAFFLKIQFPNVSLTTIRILELRLAESRSTCGGVNCCTFDMLEFDCRCVRDGVVEK